MSDAIPVQPKFEELENASSTPSKGQGLSLDEELMHEELSAQKGEAGSSFSKYMQEPKEDSYIAAAEQSRKVQALPSPMETASQMGGSISVGDFKNLKAELETFRERQKTTISRMLQQLDDNPAGAPPKAAIVGQLEQRMGTLQDQLNQLTKKTGAEDVLNKELAKDSAIDFQKIENNELLKPLARFFGFITKGERQLFTIEAELTNITKTPEKKMFHPADLLRLQLKMSHVQQQLELFTSLLNKGLESSKSVFNTQI